MYKDYRQMLANKDVDIVIIATPDHWHCLMLADACAAGKDVYVEKPASNSIGEATLMVAAANQHQRMVQVNQWQRSQQHFKDAIAFVHSGQLGTIAQTKAWMYNGHGILPPAADAPVPAGVDYNMWLGPAPNRTFNPNRFHYNFRWYWDYAGGLMTDWGVHLIDMVLLGMKAQMPERISSFGGHLAYPTDARETPDTQTALYEFSNFQLTWEHTMGRQYGLYGLNHGIAFTGDKGTLLLNRDGWEVRPEMDKKQLKMEAIAWQKE
ncbi:Gfo/Idh/MocA family protein [Phnomibacter ginsenosidimutans]|uniref:Gfo/Idh/MocA family protein n=1 Tax=Phnomibacter ginsenosidimutans TaxID=2676868 RepID=UPI001FE94441|nr:Gfo/Idh/MocA family oxidoreductase [Phnomibacter ginsenosidimutans]